MFRTCGITGKTLNKAKLHNKRKTSASKDAEVFVALISIFAQKNKWMTIFWTSCRRYKS